MPYTVSITVKGSSHENKRQMYLSLILLVVGDKCVERQRLRLHHPRQTQVLHIKPSTQRHQSYRCFSLDHAHLLAPVSCYMKRSYYALCCARLMRSEFFPGLGWLCPRALWEGELRDAWPRSDWDHWLRYTAIEYIGVWSGLHQHCLSHLFNRATRGSVGNSNKLSQASFLCVSFCLTFLLPMCVCVCDAAVRLSVTVDETVSTRKCPAPTIMGARAHS